MFSWCDGDAAQRTAGIEMQADDFAAELTDGQGERKRLAAGKFFFFRPIGTDFAIEWKKPAETSIGIEGEVFGWKIAERCRKACPVFQGDGTQAAIRIESDRGDVFAADIVKLILWQQLLSSEIER